MPLSNRVIKGANASVTLCEPCADLLDSVLVKGTPPGPVTACVRCDPAVDPSAFTVLYWICSWPTEHDTWAAGQTFTDSPALLATYDQDPFRALVAARSLMRRVKDFNLVRDSPEILAWRRLVGRVGEALFQVRTRKVP